MLGKILSISEVCDIRQTESPYKPNTFYGGMDGYEVLTDKHRYQVLIDNGQSCCEDWGYLTSEDDLELFVGAQLLEVRLTDTELRNTTLNEGLREWGFDGGGVQFVDFVTDRGVFQLAVYNSHNGYYGHGIAIWRDEEVLLDTIL